MSWGVAITPKSVTCRAGASATWPGARVETVTARSTPVRIRVRTQRIGADGSTPRSTRWRQGVGILGQSRHRFQGVKRIEDGVARVRGIVLRKIGRTHLAVRADQGKHARG